MPKLELGYIGLGRMGLPMVKTLSKDISITAYDIDIKKCRIPLDLKINIANSIIDLARALSSPRIIWIMVPMGNIVDEVIQTLIPELQEGDLLVDGGNANYLDSIRRRDELSKKKLVLPVQAQVAEPQEL